MRDHTQVPPAYGGSTEGGDGVVCGLGGHEKGNGVIPQCLQRSRCPAPLVRNPFPIMGARRRWQLVRRRVIYQRTNLKDWGNTRAYFKQKLDAPGG